MLRFWVFQAHWFIGITAGVILAFVGATGALLSFETEIVAWLNRDARVVHDAAGARLTMPELLEQLALAEPARRVVNVTVFGGENLQPRVTFADSGPGDEGKLQTRVGDPSSSRAAKPVESRGDSFYVGMLGAEVSLLRGDRGEAFFRNVRTLHRWLTLESRGDRELGRQVVGLCTLLLIGLAATGLYLRWPRGRATQWRVWLTFSPRLRGRNLLWHLHAIVATWVLAFYLVIGLTGLYWSYEWYRDGLVSLLGASPPPARSAGKGSIGSAAIPATVVAAGDAQRAWRAFLEVVGDEGFQSATFECPPGGRRVISVRYLASDAPHPRAFDALKIDAATGRVLETRLHADKPAGDRALASVFPLHSGRFFGVPGVIAFMVASLCMPLFAVTGWMLYLERRRKRVTRRWAIAGTD